MNVRYDTSLAALLVVLIGLTGCKEATLGPELWGDVEGTVFDHATSEALSQVTISTSPPTSALITDEAGRFVLKDVAVGTYTLTARHPNYQSATVTVSIQENRMTQAAIFLKSAPDTTDLKAALEVEVTRWTHRTAGDSTFVEVEYRARNTGTAAITAYEVYFRIDAGDVSSYEEVQGENLHARQADIGRFERYLGEVEASAVVVDGVWFAE